ncbi:DNA polymerase IV [Brumimicrobium aurantiacum]|uniref:DNA polymerase IV n=1 Tax=Brumimicrobium aurantiacum TaxID=1737063 RepID=A0A3E1EUB4_9FLAO|nr:DNA polymerase IV [Brumimicrobium aurantiacum]RFC53145.1 DNA polymerase IV [Brumimicrobium aurantiacum]
MQQQHRAIVHMDLDTFFVSCERLTDSRLEGKPILIGGSSDRGVVASCSYEARKFGIHSAMPMKLAIRRCPEAIVIAGNSETYSKYSRLITDIVKDASPVYEKSSIDEFYMDFSGMDKFFGCLQYAKELRERIIRESGLPISFGLSENKTVSKIATGEAKPNNAINVDYGSERTFLAPLSIRKIPSVGLKTYQTFCGLGVKKIQTLQEMPVELLEQVFGKMGRAIWKKAHGIDTSPVVQYNEKKSISTEHTFEQDSIDIQRIRALLCGMGEKLTYKLRLSHKVTACVTVKVRYSDFQTKTLQRKIPYTAADHEIIPLILTLFNQLYQRRVRVRLVGVRLSHLVQGGQQISLFTDDGKYSNLYQAMDRIRNRFGKDSVMYARSK